jgi:hypothetical protein
LISLKDNHAMKYIILFLLPVTIISCNQNKTSEETSTSIIQHSSDSVTESHIAKAWTSDTYGWPDKIFEKIKKYETSFIRQNLRSFDCSLLDPYFYDYGKITTKGLTEIDSIAANTLFGNYVIDGLRLDGGYFFSIERPIHNFYPITIIKGFGVEGIPLTMILFDENGTIVNTLDVMFMPLEGASGCMKSRFVNDSTLVQHSEFAYYAGTDSAGNDLWNKSKSRREITIHSTGKVTISDLDNSTTRD